jgi:hypothetical protein
VRFADTVGIVLERQRRNGEIGMSNAILIRIHVPISFPLPISRFPFPVSSSRFLLCPSALLDKLRWYCEDASCRAIVYEESFHCTDLGTQLKPVIEKYANDPALRKCKKCGLDNPAK